VNVPSMDEMLGWIETVCARGIRRPGHPADTVTTNWAADLFTQFGLEPVTGAAIRIIGSTAGRSAAEMRR
jgi:hypothetical protein